MITVITSLGGQSLYEMSSEFSYPKILNEINNKTLFEYSQEIISHLPADVRRIFLLPKDKDDEYQLSPMISVASHGRGEILHIQGDTGGAVCSCLLAIDKIDPEDEVIVISADQYIRADLTEIIDHFRSQSADAGVLTFTSLHPKWAFIRKQADGRITEVAEKRTISREAIAGFYYFRKGHFFMQAAQRCILKGATVNGQYYLSGCLNEMILENKKIIGWPLEEGSYHNFYDNHAIKAFASSFRENKPLLPAGFCYSDIFGMKTIRHPEAVFDAGVTLQDNGRSYSGSMAVSDYLIHLIGSAEKISIELQSPVSEGNKVIMLYSLYHGDVCSQFLDVIALSHYGKIQSVQHSLLN
ncbi:sugar phosphate nucleotidyltransferase [Tatumella sp. JGM118]|uniref:sugar phosphate nucleotidyltransferase n=1 Tax=Tatumella sp. JGM118 TaxID=2799796 RepID=UPI001BB09727|nr:sugar phosphate nucleotidyltransferase [Tatumella sp. JGM118]MBS0910317.1 hypothetical protein [Tatumella sp. JGM118]